MAKTVQSIIESAKSNGATVSNGFSKAKIRQGLNTLHDGDIITFPTDLTGKVITQPMLQHNKPVMRVNPETNVEEPVMLEYIVVDVERKGNPTAVPFYPSAFGKSRQLADEVGGEGNGTYEAADGAVVDLVNTFDENEMDQAILAIAAKGRVKVNLRDIIGVDFNTKKGKKMTLPTFSWAD